MLLAVVDLCMVLVQTDGMPKMQLVLCWGMCSEAVRAGLRWIGLLLPSKTLSVVAGLGPSS